MVRFYDKVYVRAASTAQASIAKSTLSSSWNLLPAGLKVTQELSLKTEADVTTAMGDGTDQIGSEAGTAELQIVNFTGAQLTTIRSAFLNVAVDMVVYDSKADTAGYALWGVQLYPSPELASGKEQIIKLSGKKRYAADMSPALAPITLT
ncbi:hypothetical protein MASR1M36_08940 [Candidatus Cloacimonadaceae bacterium]